MGEQEFWNGKERFFSDIINRVNDLLSDAYLLITNRNSHVTMIPEKTAAFFEMQAGYVKDFYQILLDHVHPDDRPEYLQAMEKRLLGQKLSDELYIRLKNKDHYDMFGFFMSVVKEDGNEYLLRILVNQNVIPEIDALTDLYDRRSLRKMWKDISEPAERWLFWRLRSITWQTSIFYMGRIIQTVCSGRSHTILSI